LNDDHKIDFKSYRGVGTALWIGALNNDAQLELSGESDGKPTLPHRWAIRPKALF
jgi:hypothetical protein